jgi:hypothetical protein
MYVKLLTRCCTSAIAVARPGNKSGIPIYTPSPSASVAADVAAEPVINNHGADRSTSREPLPLDCATVLSPVSPLQVPYLTAPPVASAAQSTIALESISCPSPLDTVPCTPASQLAVTSTSLLDHVPSDSTTTHCASQLIVKKSPGWDEDGLEYRDEDDKDDEDLEDEFADVDDDSEPCVSGNIGSKPSSGQLNLTPTAGKQARATLPRWLNQKYGDLVAKIKHEISSNPNHLPKCYVARRFVEYPPDPIFTTKTFLMHFSPEMFFEPQFFIWLPHLFQKILCPNCLMDGRRRPDGTQSILAKAGFSPAPRRVIDIDQNIYILGYRYYCGMKGCGKSYQSWSPAVLSVLSPALRIKFSFHLTHHLGLTDGLVALLRSSFQRGLGPAPFVEMIRTFHIRRHEQLHIQYLEMVKDRISSVQASFLPLHSPFGLWDDLDGYAGYVPSHKYFRSFYDVFIERHAAEIDQHMAMLSGRILCIDHSFKVRF